ncbi:hypothetical protein BS50DRAFT_586418 [Corynespora cassiicola Philippines]|uniref:RCC1/BLIP-II n=1 Tax=Corynespora cassiicola Philippines TaxID=1448308 RepID=A0A2T2NUE3_CORCC|nr:hypothetical protein BS50DRAFT_586418 [Corynespora cassiicola Philippines]
MQSLTIFGFESPEKPRTLKPRPLGLKGSMQIKWSSWSDFVVSVRGSGPEKLTYYGRNLTRQQRDAVSIASSSSKFFGEVSRHGLRGFFGQRRVVVFKEDGTVRDYSIKFDFSILDIFITVQGNIVVIALRPLSSPGYCYHDGCIAFKKDLRETRISLEFTDMIDFQSWLEAQSPLSPLPSSNCPQHRDANLGTSPQSSTFQQSSAEPDTDLMDLISQPKWLQKITNGALFVAIDEAGKVHTWTKDERYHDCLGRTPDLEYPGHKPSPVTYLSELVIEKIAIGGWMTAAIDTNGELFIWGHSPPGQDGELLVLAGKPNLEEKLRRGDSTEEDSSEEEGDEDDSAPADSALDEDELVKTVPLFIDGLPAKATHVAIGIGHVLVAAELHDHPRRTAVFGAGRGHVGQLGMGRSIDFLDTFSPIPFFDGADVKQVACAPFTSFVITHEKVEEE